METIVIDASREIRIWRSGISLHVGEYQSDGKGGMAAGPTLTLPASQGQELAAAIQQVGDSP